MSQHRVVCTIKEPASQPRSHAHIVELGTSSDGRKFDKLWTLLEIYTSIDSGDEFFTVSPSTGRRSLVQKYNCHVCNHFPTVRSDTDAVRDNDLDRLPRCQ
jgi:hypothetical protein